MTPNPYPHLLSPIRLSPGVELRNRVVVTAHGTGLAEDGLPGPRLVAYHRERAVGGAALLITEHNSVHPSSALLHGTTIRNHDDLIIEPYRRLASAVHEHGARIFVQLAHAGLQSAPLLGRGYVVGPSADGALPASAPIHELTPVELHELVDAFAAAAGRVTAGGVDGIELHLGHGNLLQQFLSPVTNRRTDSYGGSEDRRLTFPREVMRAVFDAAGDFPVGLRLSADELVDGGLRLDDMLRITAELLNAASRPPVYLSVSAGQDMDPLSAGRHQASSHLPPGHLVPYARAFRGVFKPIPVICVGRITEPELGEAIVAGGDADLVGMTRAHIADPHLVAKATGVEAEPRVACIGCNAGCLGRLERGLHVSCVQNPATGREDRIGQLPGRARENGLVVVLGGGPAGLEAAVTAARIGHRVVLYERAPALGGRLALASRLPGLSEYAKVIDHRRRLIEAFDVDVRLGAEPDPHEIAHQAPLLTVVATGSRPVVTEGVGVYIEVEEIIAHGSLPEGPLTIIDEIGGTAAAAFAELGATPGRRVSLVTAAERPLERVERGMRAVMIERLLRLGIRVLVRTRLVSDEGAVWLVDGWTAERELLEPNEVIVRVSRRVASAELAPALVAAGLPITIVGDAVAPRGMEAAIFEGRINVESLLVGLSVAAD